MSLNLFYWKKVMDVVVTDKFIEVIRRKKIAITSAVLGESIFFPVGNRIEQYAGIYDSRNLISAGAFSSSHSSVLDPRLIKIGRYCTIENGVKIAHTRHPMHFLTTNPILYAPSDIQKIDHQQENNIIPYKTAHQIVEIEHDVLIEQNSTLITGVKVHTGAVVKAGSVVCEDVPPYAIVQGNPAKIIAMRFDDDIITRLLDSQWWHYNIFDLAYLNVTNISEFLDKFDQNKQHLSKIATEVLEWDEMVINSLEPTDVELRKDYYNRLAWHFEQNSDLLMAEDLRQRAIL